MRKALFSLVLLCTALLCVDSTSAQVQRISGSGCLDAAFPRILGTPSIGSDFGVLYPRAADGEIPFVMIGLSRRLVLTRPLTCRGPCLLSVSPIVAQLGNGWRTPIPDDRGLIGACVTIQGGSIVRRAACLRLQGAIRACITR